MKHYHDGTRVSDEVMKRPNALLRVEGNLTDDRWTPPPPPPPPLPGTDKRLGRPNVIEANHLVETGRVSTGRFM